MAERIPIAITPKRKSNFAVAHFEVKIIVPLIFISGIVPLLLTLIHGDLGNIASATIIPGASSFYGLATIEAFKLSFGDQSLKTQIQRRLGVISIFLFSIFLGCFHLYPYHNPYYGELAYKKAYFYRPLYIIALPIFFILILMIRTIPMTIRFYKLKRQKQLTV
jgi:hypothetical protein